MSLVLVDRNHPESQHQVYLERLKGFQGGTNGVRGETT